MQGEKTSTFKIILLGIFVFFIVIGVIVLATYNPSQKGQKQYIGKVQIWGTLDGKKMNDILNKLKSSDSGFRDVSYKEIDKKDFQMELLNALAEHTPPDLIVVSNKNLFQNLKKIYQIPPKSYSLRRYVDNYIDASSVFYDDKGIYAFPILIDPLVMYYNKDILKNNSIPTPPKYWDDFYSFVKKTTIINEKKNIEVSGLSFGETANVQNFKEILATLFMQTGNKIIFKNESGNYQTDSNFSRTNNPREAINYFLTFSNQVSPNYSWNSSLPNSKDFFLSGKLATYFGFASEIVDLRNKSPNLDFDVAEVPILPEKINRKIYANIWGLAVLKDKDAKNIGGALKVAVVLAGKEMQTEISKAFVLPSVRKDLINQNSGNIYMDVFNREVVFADTFVDPNDKETKKTFRLMIDEIKSGKMPSSSLKSAYDEISVLFER